MNRGCFDGSTLCGARGNHDKPTILDQKVPALVNKRASVDLDLGASELPESDDHDRAIRRTRTLPGLRDSTGVDDDTIGVNLEIQNEEANRGEWKRRERMVPHMQDRLREFMTKSLPGRVFTVVNAALSVGACIIYVWSTYVEEDSSTMRVLKEIEIWLSAWFTLDYLILFYIAPDKWAYVNSWASYADVLAIIPVAAYLYTDPVGSKVVGWLQSARIFRAVARPMKALYLSFTLFLNLTILGRRFE